MSKIIEKLVTNKILENQPIIEAFEKVNRADFVPREVEKQANSDTILPISYGAYLPRFTTAAQLIEELSPKPQEVILHIGAGSGWITAILSLVVGEKGKVIAIEEIPDLAEIAKKDLSKYPSLKNIEFLEEEFPDKLFNKKFNRILVTSRFLDKFKDLLPDCLYPDGTLVSLLEEEIYCLKNNEEKTIPLLK